MNFSSALVISLLLGVLACDKKQAPASQETSPPVSDAAPASSNEIDSKTTAAAELQADFPACRNAAGSARPSVRWAADAGLTGDVTFDGATDLILWGTEGDSLFVLSVVECPDGKAGRVWSIPLRAIPAFGTLDLEVQLMNPAFGQGYLQENCMGAETTPDCRQLAAVNARLEAAYQRGGLGLMIGVPDRHNIHMYWDSDSSRFVMWGL